MCFYCLFSFIHLGLALSSYVTEALGTQEPFFFFLKRSPAGIEVSKTGLLESAVYLGLELGAKFWNWIMLVFS